MRATVIHRSKPILDFQSRHALEVAEITGKQCRVVGNGDARNAQVHRSNADMNRIQPTELKLRSIVPGQNCPISQILEIALEPGVLANGHGGLPRALDQPKQATQLLIDRNELQVCVARSRRTNRVGLNAGGGVGWLGPQWSFQVMGSGGFG